ncbi:hypothetical protein ABZP36_015773 [Zizania latifolia]
MAGWKAVAIRQLCNYLLTLAKVEAGLWACGLLLGASRSYISVMEMKMMKCDRLNVSSRRMKKHIQDLSMIEAAIKTSSKLVVSSDCKRTRRLHPLHTMNSKMLRAAMVENLPSDFSMESIHATFKTVGKNVVFLCCTLIVKITIHDQHSVGESATTKKPDIMLSNIVTRICANTKKTNAKRGRRARYRSQGRGQIQQNTSGQAFVAPTSATWQYGVQSSEHVKNTIALTGGSCPKFGLPALVDFPSSSLREHHCTS